MTDGVDTGLSDRARAARIAGAGIVIILLAAGAALLPVLEPRAGSTVIGSLLLVAGVVEAFAGSFRRDTRGPAMIAGAVTIVAGILFFIDRNSRIFPTVNIVIAWLLIRSVVLFVASRRTGGSVRMWLTISAATDLLIGILLLVGLSLSTAVVILFGPTPAIIASFAWVLALSFVATGLLLLEVASCERESAG